MSSTSDLEDLRERLVASWPLVLDGGLATELEARGCDLADPLWSARVLLEEPDLILRVHRDYLAAGAECLISASYQASVSALEARGLSKSEAEEVLLRSVDLAREAVRSDPGRGVKGRALVAASIGPYGAFLADGSEFVGNYGRSQEELARFHRRRLQVLASSSADLLACETVPSATEARALAQLLAELEAPAWLSFTCRSNRELRDGTPIADIAAELNESKEIVAVGVNCSAPEHVSGLLCELARVTKKPLVAYPNSGEAWNAERYAWVPGDRRPDFEALSREWVKLGARLIGGCCRTGPDDVRAIRRGVRGE